MLNMRSQKEVKVLKQLMKVYWKKMLERLGVSVGQGWIMWDTLKKDV